MRNYYDILGLNKNATQDDIKKAYREMCKKYHPDRTGGDDTKIKEINEAYATLGDENKKREYDAQNMMGGFPGFNNWFKTGNSFRMASDINVNVTISLEEAYFGCKVPVKVNGKLYSVDVPKGTPNKKMLRIPGLGQSGYNIYGQQATGDLIVTVFVRNTESMTLNNNGLLEVLYVVDWIDAILGGEEEIDIFDKKVKIRIPKYTQNGGYTIIGGKGFRKFDSDEFGSLKVNFLIRMPKSLTDDQVKELQKIKESLK